MSSAQLANNKSHVSIIRWTAVTTTLCRNVARSSTFDKISHKTYNEVTYAASTSIMTENVNKPEGVATVGVVAWAVLVTVALC